MYAIAIGLLGFILSGDSRLGASLSIAVEWMNIWFWIVAVTNVLFYIVTLLLLTTFGTALGHEIAKSKITVGIGAFFKLSASTFVSIVMLAKMASLILLTSYLSNTINPEINSLNMLTINQMLAIGGVIYILFFVKASVFVKNQKQ